MLTLPGRRRRLLDERIRAEHARWSDAVDADRRGDHDADRRQLVAWERLRALQDFRRVAYGSELDVSR